jgi:hypothetical protein
VGFQKNRKEAHACPDFNCPTIHGKRISEKNDKNKKRLQPWDNCKRLKFSGYLPHPGSRLTPFSGTNHLVSRCPTQDRAIAAPLNLDR